MKTSKREKIAWIIVFVTVVFLILFFVPFPKHIKKTISGFGMDSENVKTQATIVVDMKFLHFLLKEDGLAGNITVTEQSGKEWVFRIREGAKRILWEDEDDIYWTVVSLGDAKEQDETSAIWYGANCSNILIQTQNRKWFAASEGNADAGQLTRMRNIAGTWALRDFVEGNEIEAIFFGGQCYYGLPMSIEIKKEELPKDFTYVGTLSAVSEKRVSPTEELSSTLGEVGDAIYHFTDENGKHYFVTPIKSDFPTDCYIGICYASTRKPDYFIEKEQPADAVLPEMSMEEVRKLAATEDLTFEEVTAYAGVQQDRTRYP